MDIMNLLPEDRYNQVDDLLAFISIYDDHNRTRAFLQLLEDNAEDIRGKVCVELGTGIGLLSEKMAQLGARKVYAVEVNPFLFQIAQKRLSRYKNVELIQADARNFVPPEPVHTLVHEFYGQLLYDEELYILDQLPWKPAVVLPDGGKLAAGLMDIEEFDDPVVNADFMQQLSGVLVSGLFDEEDVPLDFDVVEFRYGKPFPLKVRKDISAYQGNLLYFGLKVMHQGQEICQAGICSNWSYVWTWRAGNVFEIEFVSGARAPEVIFQWID